MLFIPNKNTTYEAFAFSVVHLYLTYNSKNSPILFRWWDELPPPGFEKNKVFRREHLFESLRHGIIISAAAVIQ